MDDKEYLTELGRKIKTARTLNKVSLRKLSVLCKTDMSNLWYIENGQRNARLLTLKSIADVFNMDVKDFL